MKYTIVLCLALAVGSSAYRNVNFQPLMDLQHKAMQRLISSHAANDDPSKVSACFDDYILEQQGVLTNYNIQYSGCVRTAQEDKSELTAQSEANRRELISRSEGMCNVLSSCEGKVDALLFFDCYREASANSYKVTFTLNSDANILFNTISSKYDIIDADLTNCVDVARLEYARGLEKCDSNFNECVNGGSIETTTQKPTTEEPIESTAAPAEPTEEPVDSTAAPAEPTEEPVESTAAPAEPTEEPAESTAAPAEPTEEPAESTAAPVDPTESPVESTPDPVDPTEEPVVPTEQPADPTTEKMPEEDVEKMPTFFKKLIHFF